MSAAGMKARTPLQRWLRSTRSQMQLLLRRLHLIIVDLLHRTRASLPAEQYIYQEMTDFRERRMSNTTPIPLLVVKPGGAAMHLGMVLMILICRNSYCGQKALTLETLG